MKKIRVVFCIAFAMIILAAIISLNIVAADAIDAIKPVTAFASGNGTQNDPYVIKTAGQLAYFAQQVNAGNSYSGKYVVLGDNIVWNDGDASEWNKGQIPANKWTPIGTSSKPFKGTFDGKGHTVSGLYYKGTSSDVGFFGAVSNASVKNLNIENSYFNAYSVVGSVVGHSYCTATLSGCSSDALIISNNMTPENHNVGGIVGKADGLMTEGGASTSCAVNISNCAFTGEILSDNGCSVGGIVGYISGAPAKIWGCFAEATVTGYNRVGGVLGRSYSSIEIYDCYSNCELYVFGTANIGGILGGFRMNNCTVYIHDCFYNGEFFKAASSIYGSIKPIPTRLGCNEVNTDGASVFGTLSAASNYYTDSTNDNSYSSSGNQTALPASVRRLGGLEAFVLASSSFARDIYGNVYHTALTREHDCEAYFGKWIDDPSCDGQMRECTHGNCSVVEKRGLSMQLTDVSLKYESPTAIRFFTEVDKNTFFKSFCSAEKYDYSSAGITFGTLVIPEDMLDTELTMNTVGALNIEARAVFSQDSSKLCYTAAVYGFPKVIEAYKGKLVVRSYAKYTSGSATVYEYSSPIKCSYLDVAERVYADESTSAKIKEELNLCIALGLVDESFRDESAHRVAILEYASPTLFKEYAEALSAQGFIKHTNYEYSDNYFGVYYNDDYVVSFYYTPKTIGAYTEPDQEWYAYGSHINERTEDMDKIRDKFGVNVEDAYNIMRIVVEKRSLVDLPALESENKYTPLAGMKNTITQFFPNDNYSHYGMGYAVQLADGSFIIIDGGENVDDPRNTTTDTDSDNLYKFLMAAKPASHSKPVIAAWLLTHRHDDHIGVINGFLPEYANKVVVEQVIFNFGMGTLGAPMGTTAVGRYADKYISPYLPNTKIITAHTGYKFYIRNTELTIRYSVDDLYPFEIVDGFVNNESIAFDMLIDGVQRIFFTGEVFIPGSRALVNMYGENLASDVIQLSHHGHYGATEELYKCIWPEGQDYSDEKRFVLWPIGNEEQRRNRIGLAENLWVIRCVAEDVGIEWKAEWDERIASVKNSSTYANDAARLKAIGKYLTAGTRLGYLSGALWSKIYSMCDIMFKYGNIADVVGSTEANSVPASGVLGTWETIELYNK